MALQLFWLTVVIITGFALVMRGIDKVVDELREIKTLLEKKKSDE